MLPNPALCSAILVPILLKNDMSAVMRVTCAFQSKLPGGSSGCGEKAVEQWLMRADERSDEPT
jgi:hypothetical protein